MSHPDTPAREDDAAFFCEQSARLSVNTLPTKADTERLIAIARRAVSPAPPSAADVERVARALAALEGDPDELLISWELEDGDLRRKDMPRWKHHLEQATAALAAVPKRGRDPLDAGWLREDERLAAALAAAETRGMMRAAEIADEARREMRAVGVWDKGMRDMCVRIASRIRAAASQPVEAGPEDAPQRTDTDGIFDPAKHMQTCSICGSTAVAFICDRPGCPVNGGAAYATTPPENAPRVVDHPEAGYSEWLRENVPLCWHRANGGCQIARAENDGRFVGVRWPLAPRPREGEKG